MISETSKQIIWETFYWAPYNYSVYFKQSKGHCPFFFPSIFPDLGLRLLLSFQLGFLPFHDLSCAQFLETGLWLAWETPLIWERERDEKNPLTDRELQQGYAGKASSGWHYLSPPPPKARAVSPSAHALGVAREDQTWHQQGLQRGSISIPSWFTCFLQILQLHCRQINAVICFQQGGGNPLWHFLFLNNWSCFVFPKPYWSTRLMIVFLKALFCSLCHRGSPENYN